MPPINTQGSRASLVSAVVAFTILFVVATIFAIYFNVQLRANEQEFANYKKNYTGVVSDTDLSSPQYGALQAVAKDPANGYTSADSLFSIAVQQRDTLQKAITGSAADPTAADASAKAAADAVTAANAKLKDASLVLPAKGLVSDLDALVDAVNTRQATIKQLNDKVAAAEKSLAMANASIKAHDDARDKQIADIRTQAATDKQAVQDQLTRNNAIITDLNKQLADAKATDQQHQQTAQGQLVDKDRQIAQATAEIQSAQAKLAGRRVDASNSVVRQADGRIVRLPGNDICYINLGQGDQVSPGLTFEVYDKSTGVPGIPANLSSPDDQLPIGKASIEVVRVGATSSECRIIRTSSGAALSEGDVIANLVYDPNTKYNFFVFGDFDLAETGHPSDADTQVIKRLITQWGGQLTDKINVNTDFIILGKEPTLPEYTKEELDQPLYADKYAKAQADLEHYQAIEQQAKDLHIPVLNQNRFLYYVGYYEQAKR